MEMMKRIVLICVVAAVFLAAMKGGEMTTGIGLPDWGRIKKGVAVSPVSDLGELAARLGSINTFDRRGDTVWMDDFEDGIIKWAAVAAGTGAAVVSDTTRARSGAKSVKLTTGTTDPWSAEIAHLEAYPVLSKFGLECAATVHVSLAALYVDLQIFTGSNVLQGQVAYDPGADKLYYMDSAGILQELVTAVDLEENTQLFHMFKLVVDASGEQYRRLIVDATEHDLSAYSLRKAADTTSPYMQVRIIAVGGSGGNYSIYVDNVIITQNEP